MIQRMMIPLTRDEKNAIWQLAEIEKRDPRDQAAYLIRNALEQAGLLKPPTLPTQQTKQEATQ